MLRLLLASLGFLSLLQAQGGPARHVIQGPNLPSKCAVADIWFLGTITSGTLYNCTAPNSWAAVSGGGGGVNFTLAGTSNQINVTGTCTITTTGTCTFSIPNPFIIGALQATSLTGTDNTHTGYVVLNGLTSGGQGFSVPDVAGTANLYVLPIAPSSGNYLSDGGTTTCPTLPGGAPSSCELLKWSTPVIARGQTAMATGAVSANTCTSGTTATATGATTSTVALATYASDPTGVTGYGGGTSGGITISFWTTSNTINFKECNQTGSPITPGPISLNWVVF